MQKWQIIFFRRLQMILFRSTSRWFTKTVNDKFLMHPCKINEQYSENSHCKKLIFLTLLYPNFAPIRVI